ncbi:MAG: hypothetical protein QXO47_10030 [Thermoproteota archaeon]
MPNDAKWVRLEERGRELASREIDNEWFADLKDWAREVENDIYEEIKESFPPHAKNLDLKVRDFGEEVEYAARSLTELEDVSEVAPYLYGLMIFLDNLSLSATGSRCAYSRSLPSEKHTTRLAVNDLTSCYHRLKLFLSPYKKQGYCQIHENASPEAKRACEAWSKAVTYNRRFPSYYSSVDLSQILGHAVDNTVQLRVGSSPNHMLHINLDTGSLRYYDSDEDVNKLMSDLWSSIGLKCHVESGSVLDDGVVCGGVTDENIEKAAIVASFATSLDLYISRLNSEPYQDLGDEFETTVDYVENELKQNLQKLVESIHVS